ncbi:hypothetical protein QTP88_001239 [Uroleucon formosanum]
MFTSDGKILFCKFCDVKVSTTKRFLVTQHIKTAKHEQAFNQRKRREQSISQSLLTENLNKKSDFKSDLTEALVFANIPLYKVNNLKFKNFLEKYTSKNIPDESTLRKDYVDSIYQKTLTKIQAEVFNHKIWVSIDETTDVDGRYVANVIVGVLDSEVPGKVMLVNCEHLEKTNSTTIAQLFDRTMNLIWPQGVEHNDVLLLVSDSAPYMVKAGSAIQIFYPKMLHVTCLAHALYRVAEQIRSDFPLVDKLISSVKKVFLKCPARIQIFKNEAPELSLPPEPVITPKEIIGERTVEANLAFIKSNFSFLSSALTSLEEKGKPLSNLVSIINTVSEKLAIAVLTPQGKSIHTKFQKVLDKNSGYKVLSKISKILVGETDSFDGLPEVIKADDIVNFNIKMEVEELACVAYLCSKVVRKRKKKRKFWVHPLLSDRSTKGLFNLFYNDLRKHEDKFFNYLRMSIKSFDELLELLQQDLTGQQTNMRECISPVEKLVVTLR